MGTPTPSLIIIGATGELGLQTLSAALADDGTGWPGSITATYHTSAPPHLNLRVTWVCLDCSDHKAVRELLAAQARLGAVLYCAVPRHGGAAGKGGDAVRAGIVDDVLHCAEGVVMLGARFVAVSTDLVFDGKLKAGERYKETDATCPINPYGRYKEEMERRLLGLSGEVVVARTSLILSIEGEQYGKGVQFVVDCLDGRKGEIEIFEDELRNMSFADDLGRAMLELGAGAGKGIVHMVSDEVSNRWVLAKLLAKRLGKEELLGKWAKSGLSKDSGLNRPLNCALDAEGTHKMFKTRIRGITERLG